MASKKKAYAVLKSENNIEYYGTKAAAVRAAAMSPGSHMLKRNTKTVVYWTRV